MIPNLFVLVCDDFCRSVSRVSIICLNIVYKLHLIPHPIKGLYQDSVDILVVQVREHVDCLHVSG
jgi:hypothetical protein